MVTVYSLAEGPTYAVEVRPDARVATRASLETGLVEITFTDRAMVALTLILPAEVARQVFGEPRWSLLTQLPDETPS